MLTFEKEPFLGAQAIVEKLTVMPSARIVVPVIDI